MTRNTLVRSLHDVGLAAWFGGTLANAVALNAASAQPRSARDTAHVANTGWDRWTPVNAAAIGAHLVGGTGPLLVGAIIGALGRLVVRGRQNIFMIATILIGIVAAMVGHRVTPHCEFHGWFSKTSRGDR